MLALLASLLTSLAAGPSASMTCADQPASCDARWGEAAGPDVDDPTGYATPVEVDCPAPVAIGQMFSESCDGAPPDLWYRVSRFPDDGPAGTVAAGHRPRNPEALASASGLPPADSAHIPLASGQPLALAAGLPAVALGCDRTDFPRSTKAAPARWLTPPERPPRG